MGPSNVALVKLYQADQKLREAQGRLDALSKNVRIQERKLHDLTERLRLTQSKLKEQQAQSAGFELDLKSREAKIERLRSQQQNANNNKEYQVFLVEINTEKVDKGKIEEQLLKSMESVEKLQNEAKELSQLVESESIKLKALQAEIGDRAVKLQAEIDALRPLREAAYEAASPKWRDEFERLADKFEGEAMSALAKPDRRREEYACTACNMDLVTDIYNKLHSRDEMVFCPSCRRILYIPADLPIEMAVNTKPKKAEKKVESSVGRE
jgi:predicted  nucleic acid-binding Zn-ribbon protein